MDNEVYNGLPLHFGSRTQNISLVSGWNWTAYLPTLKQAVGTAIDSILTQVTQVKSQYKFVIKINSSLVVWKGFYECHIEPDWLLIYRINKDKQELELAKTGAHSDLF